LVGATCPDTTIGTQEGIRGPAMWWSGTQDLGSLGAGLTQERGTTFGLLGVPDLLGSLPEGMQGAQEAPVGFVVPGNRAVTLPPGATQLIKASVVTGAGVGVSGDRLPVGQSQFRQTSPGGRVGGIASGDRCGVVDGCQRLTGFGVIGQVCLGWFVQQVLVQDHVPHPATGTGHPRV